MSDKGSLKINDIGKNCEQLTTVDPDCLMPLPGDIEEGPWEEISDDLKEKYACILDDTWDQAVSYFRKNLS